MMWMARSLSGIPTWTWVAAVGVRVISPRSIATIAAYLAYARRPSVWRYAVIMLCLFLTMGAKPIYAALPVGLLTLDLWPLDRAVTAWNDVLGDNPGLEIYAIGAWNEW